jgi:predicted nucleic-acid-binding Zn-ribbon protein
MPRQNGEKMMAATLDGGAPTLNKSDPAELCWECNECGSQEFTLGIAEHELEKLGCTGCGGSEFHKAAIRDGDK